MNFQDEPIEGDLTPGEWVLLVLIVALIAAGIALAVKARIEESKAHGHPIHKSSPVRY